MSKIILPGEDEQLLPYAQLFHRGRALWKHAAVTLSLRKTPLALQQTREACDLFRQAIDAAPELSTKAAIATNLVHALSDLGEFDLSLREAEAWLGRLWGAGEPESEAKSALTAQVAKLKADGPGQPKTAPRIGPRSAPAPDRNHSSEIARRLRQQDRLKAKLLKRQQKDTAS